MTITLTSTLCALLATGVGASPGRPGNAAPDSAAPPPATAAAADKPDLSVHAIRLDVPVTIDGVLSEAVWRTGIPVTRFLQRDPVEGAPATERTEVRVAYDDDAIYVGARMYDSHPDSIVSRLCRRDVSISSDRFAVFLDPFHDHRSGYYFMVNASGVQYDGTLFNDSWDDNAWDGVWQGRAHVDREGWTAEMRIPFSQLRFERRERYVWGIDFRRELTRRSELAYLVIPPKNESGFVSRFPDLVDMDGVRAGRSIELMPYVTGKAEFLLHNGGDPFNDGSRYKPSGGGDLRMGVGGNLTLNATLNPDFGQVEVDPAVVNRTDVETYFPEKRPFFVENSRVFSFGNEGANDYWGFNWPEPTFFYSRRIGRNPEGIVPDSAFADVPSSTHILGAAKLTGKLAPGWNFGTLHALTAKESAELYGSGAFSKAEVEPLTYYGLVRTQKEFPKQQHGLGFMTSVVSRRFDDGQLRDQLNSASVETGLDGWHFLDRKQLYVISGWAMGSLIQGSPSRMTAVQQGSRHYFQRPDATSYHVDPNATSLAGYGARVWLNKQSGKVLLNSALGIMSPKFDVNDLGYQTRTDVVNSHFGTGYQWSNLTRWRKYASILGALFGSRNYDGNIISAGIWTRQQIEFINNYTWNNTLAFNPQTVNPRRTRGGPLTLTLKGYEWDMYFDTDSKSKLFYFIESDNYFTESGSKSTSLYPGVEWKPVSSMSLRVGPAFERNIDDAAYVETVADPLATATFGRRYVFATLDQNTISAQIQLNWAFRPNLSLQTFLQPLVSSGDYHDFKEVARAKSYDFLRYGTGASTFDPNTMMVDPDGPGPAAPFSVNDPNNHDFNVRTLQGNAVLRWEYKPGSTLFLVWTQKRDASTDVASTEYQHSFDRLVNARPNNVFLAKVTYYFTR